MRVLKFKDLTEEFHRGEIVIRPNYATSSDGLFLLLEDIEEDTIFVKVFFIGTISSRETGKFASLIFNTKDKTVTIRNNISLNQNINQNKFLSFRKMTQDEKELFFEALTDNKYYNPDYYLNIVKKETGLDIREIYKDEYEEYLMKRNAKKYNL